MFDFQFTVIASTLFVAHENKAHLNALSEILRYALLAEGLPDPHIAEDEDGGHCLTTADLALTLRWTENGDEARLTVALGYAEAEDPPDMTRLQGLLIDLLRPLVAALRVRSVDWLQTGLRIPACDFVDAVCVENTTDDTPDHPQIAPRRVARAAGTSTARPAPGPTCGTTTPNLPMRHGPVHPRRIRPATATAARRPPLRHGPPRRQDAHVRHYEAHLAQTLRRPPTDAELEAMRVATGQPSTPERLAIWAISLSVATVSLPMAVPVLVGNLVHGENLRAASLVMGLVGVFSLTSDPATTLSLVTLF